jgi:hypothetical protein
MICRTRPVVEILESRLTPAAHTWSGGGGANANWSNPLNWAGNSAPAANETVDLTFPAVAGNLANTDNVSGLVVHSLTLTGGSYHIGGSSGVSLAFQTGSQVQNGGQANDLLGNLPLQFQAVGGSIHTFTVAAGTALNLAGPLGGAANTLLIKAGGGTLTLAGNSGTLSLQTRVDAGTAVIDGAQPANTVTVNSGATLGGTGTVGGIAVSGGTVSPGDPVTSPGRLTAAGNVSLRSVPTGPAGIFVVQLNGTAPGTGYDQLQSAGSVNLAGATLTASLGFTSHAGDSFTIVSAGGGLSGTFAGLPNGSTTTIGGDTFRINYTATTAVLTHVPGAATHFQLTAPASVRVGVLFNITVTALDANNDVATGYRGTVHFSSSDSDRRVMLPPNHMFTAADNGTHLFQNMANLFTLGRQMITAADVASGINGGTVVNVVPGPADHYMLGGPMTVTACTSFTLTAAADDVGGNTATDYNGTASVTENPNNTGSMWMGGTSPWSVGFSSGTASLDNITAPCPDNDSLPEMVTYTIHQTSSPPPAVSDATYSITFVAGAFAQFIVNGPLSVAAGQAFSFTVTAADAHGYRVRDYSGVVHFTSSDSRASLPPDYRFTTNDQGQHTFAATLRTAGQQTVTVTDVARGVMGRLSTTVIPGPAQTLILGGLPTQVTAGQAAAVTVTLYDAYGNVATGYTGTVHFSSTDPQASLPADTPVSSGSGTFNVTLGTAGSQTVTVRDTAQSTLSDTATTTVVPGPLDHFSVTASVDASGTVAGSPFDVTVTAQDAYNNTVTTYTGTVSFSSQDPYGATLPVDYTFRTNDQGQATFASGATLYTAGVWDVTAADTTSGTSGSDFIGVTAASAVGFQVNTPASVTSGTAFDVTLVAVDPYGNTDTNFLGTVTWTTTDTDPGVTLPVDYTFQPTDAGVVTFPGGVTLVTPGDQTLTATDTVSGINGSATVTVTMGPSGAQDPGARHRRRPGGASPDQVALDAWFSLRFEERWDNRTWAAWSAAARVHRGQADPWADVGMWDGRI